MQPVQQQLFPLTNEIPLCSTEAGIAHEKKEEISRGQGACPPENFEGQD